jgi:aminoglycoside phosphotransferase (APT) family kinase protein
MDTAILDYLAGLRPPVLEHNWNRWRVVPVASGNNRLYRVTNGADDWAIKFTIRDDRDRARREFNALSLLENLGASVAPRPVHLDLDHYEHSVVVQTWLPGMPLWSAPPEDDTWLQILRAYHRLHSLPPADGGTWGAGHGPMLSPITPEEMVTGIHALVEQLPPAGRPERLSELLQSLDRVRLPRLPTSRCWAHGDPNIRNLILKEDGVKLVDWEYSGVTDPANEMAKLISHPIAASAGEARWDWVAQQYAELSAVPEMLPRIQLCYALRLVGWCVRLLFGRHVLLQRPSVRLVGHGPEAEISTVENIDLYFDRASRRLAALSFS